MTKIPIMCPAHDHFKDKFLTELDLGAQHVIKCKLQESNP